MFHQVQVGWGHHGHFQLGTEPEAGPRGARTDAFAYTLSVAYGLFDALAVALAVPVVDVRHAEGRRDPARAEGEQVGVLGIGDPMALLRLLVWDRGVRVLASGGATIPVGTASRATGGDFDQVAGNVVATGTADPVVMLDAVADLSERLSVTAGAGLRAPVYDRPRGGREGLVFNAGLGLGYALAGSEVQFTAGLELVVRQPSMMPGGAMAGDVGGRWVYAVPGLMWSPANGVSVQLGVQLPVYQDVVGIQLAEDFNVVGGLSFLLPPPAEHRHDAEEDEEDEHDPAAEHGPTPTGGDVADVIQRGENADLGPVSGKVTVIDFWAVWCEPCHDLEARLRRLAAEDPRLAVRRANVVDWDSPAARRYLGSVAGLPYVVAYRADGAIAFAMHGDPAAIAKAVADLLGER